MFGTNINVLLLCFNILHQVKYKIDKTDIPTFKHSLQSLFFSGTKGFIMHVIRLGYILRVNIHDKRYTDIFINKWTLQSLILILLYLT